MWWIVRVGSWQTAPGLLQKIALFPSKHSKGVFTVHQRNPESSSQITQTQSAEGSHQYTRTIN